jgi:hypothetical protein
MPANSRRREHIESLYRPEAAMYQQGFSNTVSALFIDPTLTTSGTFSNVLPANNFVDGIAWETTGTFLFLANRLLSDQLTILDRNCALVQNVPMTSEPDGIAFHAVSPKSWLPTTPTGR